MMQADMSSGPKSNFPFLSLLQHIIHTSMKKLFLTIALTALTLSGFAQDQLPSRAEVLKLAQKVNSWFMKKYDPADAFLGGGKVRPEDG